MERSLHCLQNQQCQSAEKQPSITWRERIYRWHQLRRERDSLRHLSDDMLRDIGISRDDVQREARRPFWDDSGWRR